MGTCCSSRTDMSGKDKTSKKGASLEGGKTSAGVKFNPMDQVRNTITNMLKDAKNQEILVLNVPMASFADFMKDIQTLLNMIKTQTGKVFVPISLSHSPVKPKDHFIIVLRTTANIQAFQLDGWFTDNIQLLAKKFVTKTIKMDASYNGAHHIKLAKQFKELYAAENLNLIGGFQDAQNILHLLFFKLDRKPTQPLELFIETYSPAATKPVDEQREDIEEIINQAHLDNQGVLRCALSVAAGAQKVHLFVFEVTDGDCLYMIMRFNSQLQSKLDIQNMGAKTSTRQEEVNFDELMTKQINAQEHKVGKNNALTSLVINRDFDSSFIITAT